MKLFAACCVAASSLKAKSSMFPTEGPTRSLKGKRDLLFLSNICAPNVLKSFAPFVVLGTTDSLLLTRASDDSSYNFPEMLIELKDKVPLSFAEGGGHPHAGTFKFVPAQFEAVHKQMKEYIERLQ